MSLRVACCVTPHYAPARRRARGMAAVAQERQWLVNLLPQYGDAVLPYLRAWPCDGILAFQASRGVLRWARRRGIPLVDSARDHRERTPFVSVDEHELGRVAAQHLLQLGPRRLLYCGIKRNPVSQLRARCFAAACGSSVATYAVSDEEVNEGPNHLAAWLRTIPGPKACLCQDDKVAQRLLLAASQLGLAVPHDLAVLGVGDDPLLSGLSSPPLSSVRMPAMAIGRVSAEMLGALMAGRHLADTAIGLPPVGIAERASTSLLACEHPVVAEALAWITAHSCEPGVGVEAVARALGHSRRSLERWFAEQVHRSIGSEILRVRMQHAERLLSNTQFSVGDIAARCGYAGHASFTRAFQRYHAQAPLQYRLLARGNS